MTDELDSLVLEHLRHIRNRVDQIAEDVTELKHRMTSLEGTMSLVKREVAFGDETDARQQTALDKLRARIERIERRLELSDG
jgi:uncharacterized protein (UPF0335 family)